MLYEVGKRLSNREQFAFVAWSPHWMNQRYDFVYLDDPENALGELNDPSSITTIVGKYFWNDEPVAYALIKTITLTEERVDSLEEAINTAGDPLEGARQWARDNREVVQPWIYNAKEAGQPF
jgi:glycine betaine/proline transport system substrate-binding protein